MAFLEHSPVQSHQLSQVFLICAARAGGACVRGRSGQRLRLLKKREREKKREKQTDTHLSILAGGKE